MASLTSRHTHHTKNNNKPVNTSPNYPPSIQLSQTPAIHNIVWARMDDFHVPVKGPRSLMQMCKEVCIQNLAQITDLGELSYELVKDILDKVHNANQLRLIEANSPHFLSETEGLWRALIRKKFPSESAEHRYKPDLFKDETWADVYDRYNFEQKQKDAAAEAQLKMAFAGLKNQKEQSTTRIVAAKSLPNIRKVTRSGGGPRRVGGPSGSSRLAFGGGSRTSGIIQKARREAREAANRRQLSTASGSLLVQPGQIRAAPEAMVNDHRISAQPKLRIVAPGRNKNKRSLVDDDLLSREERLRQAKKAKVASTPDDDFRLDAHYEPMARTRASAPQNSVLPTRRPRPGLLSNAPRPKGEKNIRVISPEKEEPPQILPRVPVINKTYKPPPQLLPSTQRQKAKPTNIRPPRRTPSPSPPPRLREETPPYASPGSSPLRKPVQPSSPVLGAARSPDRGPMMMPRKKKPADIFMKTKKNGR